MIPTESIKQLFSELQKHLTDFLDDDALPLRHSQFYRGISTN